METEIVEEYGHGHQITKVTERESEPRYYFEDPLDRLKKFESLDRAKLYADVYTVVDGFREEHSGKRGCPPVIAQSREDIQMAYYVAQNGVGAGTSLTWTARMYDRSEADVRQYIGMVRERAAEIRADDDIDSI
jgi:hypothetical protein